MPDIDLIGQVFAYAGVGLAALFVGFWIMDVITPDTHLGTEIMRGNANAALIAGSSLLGIGIVLWFSIFFTGAGWDGLLDTAVFGAVGIVAQIAGFFLLDALTPGRLSDVCTGLKAVPASWVAASVNIAMALIVGASLT